MSNSNLNAKSALARIFPAFNRPPMQAVDLGESTSEQAEDQRALPGVTQQPATLRNLSAELKLAAEHRISPGGEVSEPRPRLGQISFVNCLPIVLPIERHHVELDAEIIMEAPARLNSLFKQQQLEIGAMSSFYFLTRDDLILCPDLSISCRGSVGSVLLFSRRPLSELAGKTFVASAQSATSVALLKVLCQEQFGFIPAVTFDLRPDLDNAEIDASLVIGDQALEVDANWSQRYHRVDLGQWWTSRYGFPMVFGVWAARKQWVQQAPMRFERICAALRRAKLLGLTRRWKDTLHEARRRTALPLERLERYYRQELDFDFSDAHRQGLAAYQQLLRKHGLLG